MTRVLTSARRAGERGSALLVTLVLVGALLAGSAVLVLLQMTSTRSTDMTRTGLSALYCAEAGLAAARATMLANYTQWNTGLGAFPGEPAFLGAGAPNFISHDIDGDGSPDFVLSMQDNEDELFPAAPQPLVDSDLKVFLISRCISPKLLDNPKEVRELIQFTGGGQCYQSQLGGCGGNGNNN